MFFVSVASKELRYCTSSLFATHRRGLRSVASKGIRLQQNCAEFGHFRCFFRPGRNLPDMVGTGPDRTANGRSALPSQLRTSRVNKGRARRRLREVRNETNRASWRLAIKDYGSTNVMQLSSTYWISIRMNCGKLARLTF